MNVKCMAFGLWIMLNAVEVMQALRAVHGVERPGRFSDIEKLEAVEISNSLAVQLFERLTSEESGNVFFSPYSVTTALGMLYMGARGNSSSELKQVLKLEHLKLHRTHIHDGFRQLSELITADGLNSKYTLRLANLMLVESLYPVSYLFKEGVRKFYDAQVQNAQFDKEGPSIMNWVNAWISWKSGGGMRTLLDKPPSTDTALVLLNAVYFRGRWESSKKVQSKRARRVNFYNHGNEKAEVEMVKERAVHPYGYHPSLDSYIAELPYASGNISMIVLLPRKRDGLHILERALNGKTLSDLQRFTNRTELDLTVPTFRLEERYDLKTCLGAMGLGSLFRPFSADLTGMSPLGDLYVSKMMHRASIEVTAHGTEAFSSTSDEPLLSLQQQNNPPRFFADHPFVFLVRHNPTNLYLFMGRLNKL